jgi:hypothetical protein
LAEQAQKEETTWALGSLVLDNPLRHTSSSIRMTEEEEEEEEEVTGAPCYVEPHTSLLACSPTASSQVWGHNGRPNSVDLS